MNLLFLAATITLIACLSWMGPLLGRVFTFLKRPATVSIAGLDKATVASDNEITQAPGVIAVKNDPISTLYALTIGIDAYPNLSHLAWAVSDAKKINEFLVNDLSTPPSHIISLHDAEATRAKIVEAFQSLRDDPRIERGFPILIYFAGHGGVIDASAEWKQRNKGASKIQVIFPYDYEETCGEEKVNCIPDKTIACLLNELATAKGDNITVIFDSCHSASGSRIGTSAGGRQPRVAKVEREIPVNIDDDICALATAASTAAPRYMGPTFSTHQASHIHLAACGSNEYAWEEDGGEFTTALLKTIRAHGVDKISYRNLIVGLPHLTKQTPHFYGTHRHRTLFDGSVPSRRVAYIPVIYDLEEKTLTLQAGVASGVTDESVWELRKYAILGDEGIVGTTLAVLPDISRTKLEPEEKSDGFWELCGSGTPYGEGKLKLYARLIKSGPGNELKVWFSPEAKRLIFPELEKEDVQVSNRTFGEFRYVAHLTQDSADMLVRVHGLKTMVQNSGLAPSSTNEPIEVPEVEFILCNPHSKKYGIDILSKRIPARRAEVETILFAAARWHWYLRHASDDDTCGLVELEMFKIAERRKIGDKYSNVHRKRVPESERGNMNETGVVDFEVHMKNLYAIRLRSAVSRPLYVRMFYFDMRTFCIDDRFGHVGANGREDHVLSARGEFVIGDDAEGGTPLPFELDDGDTVDVGCVKVFWSTDPLELDNVRQESAFEMKVGAQGRKIGLLRQTNHCQWGTETLMLIQQKPVERD